MRIHLVIFVLLFSFAFGACQEAESKPVRIYLTEFYPVPAEFGNISKGISASFAGLIDDNLIVAGGCNFPDVPAADGGNKVFYKDILQFDGKKWEKTGELPRELAYGVSVTIPDGLLFVGGRNNDFFSSAVYRIRIDKTLRIDTLPALPVTFDNGAGAVLNNVLYIAGGNQNGKPSSDVWKLELNDAKEWKRCKPIPSRPLIQPVVAVCKGALYVMGGYDNASDSIKSEVSQAVWMYSPVTDKWLKVSNYPANNQYSLSGGAAAVVNDGLILTLGGVNKKVFEEALNRNAYLAGSSANQSDSLTLRMKKEAKEYLQHNIEWYKFNSTIRVFDTRNNSWTISGRIPQTALAGATVVGNGKVIYVVNGEIKPGIRSPKIWKISLKQDD